MLRNELKKSEINAIHLKFGKYEFKFLRKANDLNQKYGTNFFTFEC
jgi:hypothetical protein